MSASPKRCNSALADSAASGTRYARSVSRAPPFRVWQEWTFADGKAVRFEAELYADDCPFAAENFRALCTGEMGNATTGSKPKLHYKGTVIHRIVSNYVACAGDLETVNGAKNATSIYGKEFDDDSLKRTMNHAGAIAMVNRGPNTNGTQFFITLRDGLGEHLDGKNVCLGRVVTNLDALLAAVNAVGAGSDERPRSRITITDCGEL